MRANMKHLASLLGAYFHEDWSLDYGSPAEGLAQMVRGEPAPVVLEAREELDAFLLGGHSEEELRRVLFEDLGCCYDPTGDGSTAREWLEAVRLALHTGP